MPSWADLNERQQHYLQAMYDQDQKNERHEKSQWTRGGRPRPAIVIWRIICQEVMVNDLICQVIYQRIVVSQVVKISPYYLGNYYSLSVVLERRKTNLNPAPAPAWTPVPRTATVPCAVISACTSNSSK
jgi:hypothetical protein